MFFRSLLTLLFGLSMILRGTKGGTSKHLDNHHVSVGQRNDDAAAASSNNSNNRKLSGNVLFVLRMNKVQPGVNSLNANDQNAFVYDIGLLNAIRSQSDSITFEMKDGSTSYRYTAYRSVNYNNTSNGGDEFMWDGLLPQDAGDLFCGDTWGILVCNIRVLKKVIDSYYRVTVEDDAMLIRRSPKESEEEVPPEEHVPGQGEAISTVVFYTAAAAAKARSSKHLQDKITQLFGFDSMTDFFGRTPMLVSIWELPYKDESNWEDFVGTKITQKALNSFTSNQVLLERKDLLGGDQSFLVHDWSVKSESALASFNDGTLLIDVDKLVEREVLSAFLEDGLGDPSADLSNPPRSRLPVRSIRVDPAIAGNQRNWWDVSCPTGIRGIGLYKYRYDDKFMDIHNLKVVCRGQPVLSVGAFPRNYDSRENYEPISCREGLVGGVGVTRYRVKETKTDNYQLHVYCPNEGWLKTSRPDGEQVSQKKSGYWDTTQYGNSTDLTFLKLTLFRTKKDNSANTDTLNLDLAFDEAKKNYPKGSLFQDKDKYKCMHLAPNGKALRRSCTGQDFQTWRFTGTGAIKNPSQDLCLTYFPPSSGKKNVFFSSCDGGVSQKWIYDDVTEQWYPQSHTMCLTAMARGDLKLSDCDSSRLDQRFVMDR